MKTNPLSVATRAKGPVALFWRARSVAGCYGLTTAQMDQALQQFASVLLSSNLGATFPITVVTLKRNPSSIARYLDQNIEFAIHGYAHVDYTRLSLEEQITHLRLARSAFVDMGIPAKGFRSPYLGRGAGLDQAIASAGFVYASNQPILWNSFAADALTPSARDRYRRAVAFYAPWLAHERLSVPRLQDTVVEIPVSLPDDEILVDRLDGAANGLLERSWLSILSQTHQRGELFTLQLHPERITACRRALSAVVTEARTLEPAVWCARLDEIADWWRARAAATVEIAQGGDNRFHVTVTGPRGTTILVRAVKTDASTTPWADGYQRIENAAFTVSAPCRPVIGLSPRTATQLADLLHEQGYIAELSLESQDYSIYFDQPTFTADREVEVAAQIERTTAPLIRLGRWPDGAGSALAITGDIDALTLWDYGLRVCGR